MALNEDHVAETSNLSQPGVAECLRGANDFLSRCVDIGILFYNARAPPVIQTEHIIEFLNVYKFDIACKSIVPLELPYNNERGWKWFRIEFTHEFEAEACVSACNYPGRPLRFDFYRERFPTIVTLSSFSEEGTTQSADADHPQFETLELFPHDVIVVDTQEGLVSFSTADVYRTKGAEDYIFAKKESGKIIRRLVCKHFDPVSGTLCKFGTMCSFVHVKKGKINRLLKVTSPHQELRPPKFEDDIQLSTWEFDRRHDTLVLRNLSPELVSTDLEYMFVECPGYLNSFLRRECDRVTGVVLFDSTESATRALLQTRNSGLNIGFYGVMEDLRTALLQDGRSKKEPIRPLPRLAPDGSAFATAANENANGVMKPQGAKRERGSARDDVEGHVSNRELPTVDVSDRTQTTEESITNTPEVPTDARDYNHSNDDSQNNLVTPPSEGELPFPPLPPGWCAQVSRRRNQYYFYREGGESESETLWKHPVTNSFYYPNSSDHSTL